MGGKKKEEGNGKRMEETGERGKGNKGGDSEKGMWNLGNAEKGKWGECREGKGE